MAIPAKLPCTVFQTLHKVVLVSEADSSDTERAIIQTLSTSLQVTQLFEFSCLQDYPLAQTSVVTECMSEADDTAKPQQALREGIARCLHKPCKSFLIVTLSAAVVLATLLVMSRHFSNLTQRGLSPNGAAAIAIKLQCGKSMLGSL